METYSILISRVQYAIVEVEADNFFDASEMAWSMENNRGLEWKTPQDSSILKMMEKN